MGRCRAEPVAGCAAGRCCLPHAAGTARPPAAQGPTLARRCARRCSTYCCHASSARRCAEAKCSSRRRCTAACRCSTVPRMKPAHAPQQAASRCRRRRAAAARATGWSAGSSSWPQAAARCRHALHAWRSSVASRCSPAAASRPRRSSRSWWQRRQAAHATCRRRCCRARSRAASSWQRWAARRHLASQVDSCAARR